MPGVGDQVGPTLTLRFLKAAPIGNQVSWSQDGRLGRLRACSNRTVRRRSPPARRESRHSPRRATDHRIYSLRWSTTRRCRRIQATQPENGGARPLTCECCAGGLGRREGPTLRRTVCGTEAASLYGATPSSVPRFDARRSSASELTSGSRTGDRRAQIESLNGYPWRGRRA